MDSPPLRDNIESWIWPLDLAEFRAQYWLQRPFVQERGAAALEAYSRIGPCGSDDEDWFYSLGGRPRVPIVANGRLVSTASMAMAEAVKFYRAGYAFYVTDPEPLIPSVRDFSRGLDLPISHVECNLYLSTQGCRTPVHFDATDTIVVQLRGTKIWHIGENSGVPLPLDHWGPGRKVPSSMQNYAPGEWPGSSADIETRRVVASPGTVMYLPRGYWHATETEDESISAHLHYRTVSWADLAHRAIHRELCRRPEWRRAAFGLGGDLAERRRAEGELAPLLANLVEDIAGLTTTDIVGPAEYDLHRGDLDDNARFKRVALGSVGVDSVSTDGARTMRFTISGPVNERSIEFEVPEAFAAASLWVCSKALADHFAVRDFTRFDLSGAEIRELLTTMVAAGVVERVSPRGDR